MKNYFTILLFFLFSINKIYGQACAPDNLHFSTQAEVDSFLINYPDCKVISGNVYISGNSIVDLSPLSNIQSIEGHININNIHATSFFGLHNVKYIGDRFSIWACNFITDFSGFDNLKIIDGKEGGSSNIHYCDNITSFHGLENLKYIGNSFSIQQDDMINFEGLNSLEKINGSFFLSFSEGFVNFQGLENLEEIGGSFNISIDSLESFQGLNNLKKVGNNFEIQGGKMTNLEGLNNLEYIGRDFSISDVKQLVSLQGIEEVQHIGRIFKIDDADNLTSLITFNSIDTMGSLRLSDCESLTNLNGLEVLNELEYGLSLIRLRIENIDPLQNLTSVGGIYLSENNYLIDLSAFENLETINGGIEIRDHEFLKKLWNTNNIDSINGYVEIHDNIFLDSITGLENVTVINGNLEIYDNFLLKHMNGFSSLTHIKGDFLVDYNSKFREFDAFSSLDTIDGFLEITSNPKLHSMEGFSNLKHVGSWLSLKDLPELNGLTGVEQLTKINGLTIRNCDRVKNIDLLSNIEEINGYLNFTQNDSLLNLSGLENVDFTGVNSLYINNNYNLSLCSNKNICNYLQFHRKDASIYNNDPGCNSIDEVETGCGNLVAVPYKVFLDENENGIQDVDEALAPGFGFTISPLNNHTVSNSEGNGLVYLYPDLYSFGFMSDYTPLWNLTTDSASYTLNLNGVGTSYPDTLSFGIAPATDSVKLKVGMTAPQTACGEYKIFDIIADNQGTIIADGMIWIELDTNITTIEFIDIPDSTIQQPTLKYGWHYQNLAAKESISKKIKLKIPEPPQFSNGGDLVFKSEITYWENGDKVMGDNFEYVTTVNCFTFPMSKQVHPAREGKFTLMDEIITYTIRFQNTEGITATDVIIRDELDQNLDVTTFEIIRSSHDEFLNTSISENGLIVFEFLNINLPDSTSNLEASEGYVMFQIKSKSELEEYTEIRNSAVVYFDDDFIDVTGSVYNIMVSSFDIDNDGYDVWEDCDDNNPDINPGALEIPNNNVDENCDNYSELIDNDGDGSLSDEDCDDDNENINPDYTEIPYNGIDDDCNPNTPDDDLDQDGFNLVDDCCDHDEFINPSMEEIPNNGIDEDCDGMDLMVSNENLFIRDIKIFPNPANDKLFIEHVINDLSHAIIFNSIGVKILEIDEGFSEIDISSLKSGIYYLQLNFDREMITKKFLKLQ